MTGSDKRAWVVCQIGARENYAMARALATKGQLNTLVTDVWSPPQSLWGYVPKFKGRYLESLKGETVKSFHGSFLRQALRERLGDQSPWPLIISRNKWFQAQTVA